MNRMPAEWEPHEATWLSWPKDPDTFPPGFIEKVEEAYLQIIRSLQDGEKVNLLVNDKSWEEKIRRKLEAGGVSTRNVFFQRIKTVDVWTRDYAPTFVKAGGGGLAAVKWIFNAWGNKYEELKADDGAGLEIAEKSGAEVVRPGIVLEGGSIETNGKGILLTTEQCLLNRNRNPNLTKAQLEQHLKSYLGVERIVWLGEGIVGDDTDGHIDDIARFVNENTVVCAYEEDESDANHRALKEDLELLKRAGLNVVPLPMPGKVMAEGRRLPASYANFYIGNSAVLVPVFGDENDETALATLRRFFPGRKVVGINCREFVYGFGSIHCATQQQPR